MCVVCVRVRMCAQVCAHTEGLRQLQQLTCVALNQSSAASTMKVGCKELLDILCPVFSRYTSTSLQSISWYCISSCNVVFPWHPSHPTFPPTHSLTKELCLFNKDYMPIRLTGIRVDLDFIWWYEFRGMKIPRGGDFFFLKHPCITVLEVPKCKLRNTQNPEYLVKYVVFLHCG